MVDDNPAFDGNEVIAGVRFPNVVGVQPCGNNLPFNSLRGKQYLYIVDEHNVELLIVQFLECLHSLSFLVVVFYELKNPAYFEEVVSSLVYIVVAYSGDVHG